MNQHNNEKNYTQHINNILSARKVIIYAIILQFLSLSIKAQYVGTIITVIAFIVSALGLIKFFEYSKEHIVIKVLCFLGMLVPLMNIIMLISLTLSINKGLAKYKKEQKL